MEFPEIELGLETLYSKCLLNSSSLEYIYSPLFSVPIQKSLFKFLAKERMPNPGLTGFFSFSISDVRLTFRRINEPLFVPSNNVLSSRTMVEIMFSIS